MILKWIMAINRLFFNTNTTLDKWKQLSVYALVCTIFLFVLVWIILLL